MRKIYFIAFSVLLVVLLCACSTSRSRLEFSPTVGDRTAAVIEIESTDRSVTDIPEMTTAVTEPTYFEVIAAKTTVETTTEKPPETEKPKEYFTVKFVDIDGVSSISVQNVEKGKAAKAPPMPDHRDGTVFLGWDKNFSNVQSGMIVTAIYQKEWLTVRFLDADGSVIAVEEVLYGTNASAPYVSDKGDYLFNGWSGTFTNVYKDIDVYATYYQRPVRSYTTLSNAFKLFPVKENTLGLPNSTYYRIQYDGVCTFDGEDYAGNILYGNFSDEIDIEGFGFTSLEGKVGLAEQNDINENTYALNLYVYIDGEQVHYMQITKPGELKDFSVNIVGAKKIAIRLEPFLNGKLYYQYYGTPNFIGGIIDAVLYEN